MKKLTDEQLREIAERAEKASPAPWTWHTHEYTDNTKRKHRWITGHNATANYPDNEQKGMQANADCDFICHSITDIPALLAHIKALEEEVADKEYAYQAYKTMYTGHTERMKEKEERIKELEEESKNAYEKGRLDEAQIQLENMHQVLKEFPEAHKTSHLRVCIRDLEDALKGADEQ